MFSTGNPDGGSFAQHQLDRGGHHRSSSHWDNRAPPSYAGQRRWNCHISGSARLNVQRFLEHRYCVARTFLTIIPRKRLIFTDSSMERTVEQLYRLSFCKGHSPCTCTFESLIAWIIASFGHVGNDRIAISQYAPARNRRAFDIKLYKAGPLRIQVSDIKPGSLVNTF